MWNYVVLALFTLASLILGKDEVYEIGVGIADITGPAAEIGMLGYAKMGQVSGGIHLRVFSRAFIVDDGVNRVVIVNMDSGMASDIVKIEVVKKLQSLYGSMYSHDNVLLTATHTHSAPGGFLQYVLYSIHTQGFIKQAADSQISGIVKSIEQAHNNMRKGYIYWNEGTLLNASINRSPNAYLANPAEERARYDHDTDKTMFLLKFTDLKNNPIGMLNWYAVHPTSMNNTNKLVSGDNKGYASLLFEKTMNGRNTQPGKGSFVAAFAQANEGDVSPNIMGPRCIDTGLPCDLETSTCNGKKELCIASGPGKDMFESTMIIGQRQYEKALELFHSARNKVTGSVQFIHQTVDMSNVEISENEAEPKRTCKAALGYSFAAGTADGQGEFDFKQGTIKSSPFWNLIRDFISAPSKSLIKCHLPKPILLSIGEMTFPYQWAPNIVPTQILKVGSLVIIGAPGEFTTMSGRRLRDTVEKAIKASPGENSSNVKVVISGLSNTYTHYITTYEEYQIQRYEGASTIFGPHTLEAYQKQFEKLAKSMVTKQPLTAGPSLTNLLSKQISLKPGVVFDAPPPGKRFGQVTSDVRPKYVRGETVSVSFVSGHPRNNLRLGDTYLYVEKLNEKSRTWEVIATDADWETKYYWDRTVSILGQSKVTVTWDIPKDAAIGSYRIRHTGNSKNLFQVIRSYEGTSSTFKVEKIEA